MKKTLQGFLQLHSYQQICEQFKKQNKNMGQNILVFSNKASPTGQVRLIQMISFPKKANIKSSKLGASAMA